jgi:tetratricopeptide (TPR) repeat protein
LEEENGLIAYGLELANNKECGLNQSFEFLQFLAKQCNSTFKSDDADSVISLMDCKSEDEKILREILANTAPCEYQIENLNDLMTKIEYLYYLGDMNNLQRCIAECETLEGERAQYYKASCFLQIARLYCDKNDHIEAMEYATRSMSAFEALLGDERNVRCSECLDLMGSICRGRADYHLALTHHRKALAIDLEVRGESHPCVAEVWSHIGCLQYDTGNYDVALYYHEKARKVAEDVFGWPHPVVAKHLGNIGACYSSLGEYQFALEFHSLALSIERKFFREISFRISLRLGYIGDVYSSMQDYKTALDYHEQAYKINVELKDDVEVARDLGCIGVSYCALEGYEDAIEAHQKALKIWSDHREASEIHHWPAIQLANIGNVFRNLGRYNEAFMYSRVAFDIQVRVYFLNPVDSKSVTHSNVAQALYNTAESQLDSSISDSRKYALANLLDVLSLQKKSLPETHQDVVNTARRLLGHESEPWPTESNLWERYLDDTVVGPEIPSLLCFSCFQSISIAPRLRYCSYLCAMRMERHIRYPLRSRDDPPPSMQYQYHTKREVMSILTRHTQIRMNKT